MELRRTASAFYRCRQEKRVFSVGWDFEDLHLGVAADQSGDTYAFKYDVEQGGVRVLGPYARGTMPARTPLVATLLSYNGPREGLAFSESECLRRGWRFTRSPECLALLAGEE